MDLWPTSPCSQHISATSDPWNHQGHVDLSLFLSFKRSLEICLVAGTFHATAADVFRTDANKQCTVTAMAFFLLFFDFCWFCLWCKIRWITWRVRLGKTLDCFDADVVSSWKCWRWEAVHSTAVSCKQDVICIYVKSLVTCSCFQLKLFHPKLEFNSCLLRCLRSCNFRWCSSRGWFAWPSRRQVTLGVKPCRFHLASRVPPEW